MIMEVLGKITVSEVMLFIVLVIILPMMALLLRRLRQYETLHGDLPAPERKPRGKKAAAKNAEPPAPDAKESPADADGYAYRSGVFLTSADRACLAAMREALGNEVDVYPKTALWEVVEPSEPGKGGAERLHGLAFDFLVCDARTGGVLTAVMYRPGKGRPAGRVDEVKKICAAAGANVVFIDMAESHDAKSLKDALGIPELDI